MPPIARPIPRHIAEPPHELEPTGRWAEQLGRRFLAACTEIQSEDSLKQPAIDKIEWYPSRTYSGRTYVPATVLNEDGVEFFGFVSYRKPEHAQEPTDFEARADYTTDTAEQNPDWDIDLNEEVIGQWRGTDEKTGDVTLIWGVPLVEGAVAATADLDEQNADQCAIVQSDRFTLIALDNLIGFGGFPIYVEVALWDKRGRELTRESLYEESGSESEDPAEASDG